MSPKHVRNPKIHPAVRTVNRKLATAYAGLLSVQSVTSTFAIIRFAGSFVARSAAKRTQFLFAAFASYMAVSAQAMSCCGDEACFGNAATPKLAVNESCRRRPPVKL